MFSLWLIQGHTGCGGAKACYEAAHGTSPFDPESPLGRFLAPLVKLAKELGPGSNVNEAIQQLIVENVRRQVHNIVNSKLTQGKNGTYFFLKSYKEQGSPLTPTLLKQ
jgi:carbonic anhydrase